MLFATVAVARKAGVDAESALRRTITGFAERYERFTVLAAERGIDVEAADEPDVAGPVPRGEVPDGSTEVPPAELSVSTVTCDGSCTAPA